MRSAKRRRSARCADRSRRIRSARPAKAERFYFQFTKQRPAPPSAGRVNAMRSLPQKFRRTQAGSPLAWRRDGNGWLLLAGRRRFGRVVPDPKYPGMWRSVKAGGQLSDMSNLSWAKNAVLVAAERELEWEGRQRRATDPTNCPVNGVVSGGPSSPVRQNRQAGTEPHPEQRGAP